MDFRHIETPNRGPQGSSNIADHSHYHTTLSTFTAARVVRDGLSAVGFSVSKVPGFGGKRERLLARFNKSQKPMVWAPKQHLGDTHHCDRRWRSRRCMDCACTGSTGLSGHCVRAVFSCVRRIRKCTRNYLCKIKYRSHSK